MHVHHACRSQESIEALLRAAVTCAILHPASTHRSRMLAMLYKDERVSNIAAVPQFPFLEKMLMERLITKCAPLLATQRGSAPTVASCGHSPLGIYASARPAARQHSMHAWHACRDDVVAFDRMLKDHQRAQLPDGYSVLESAVIQHNIRSVASMYHNIALSQLAALLGLPESQVETLTCDMISEGRLSGYVDQVRPRMHAHHACGAARLSYQDVDQARRCTYHAPVSPAAAHA
jgi:PCI domain